MSILFALFLLILTSAIYFRYVVCGLVGWMAVNIGAWLVERFDLGEDDNGYHRS